MHLMKTGAATALSLATALTAGMAFAEGDATRGEQLFRKCKACHQIGEGAKNSVGPNLTGVVGRPMGSSEGYRYGSGLKAANAAGGVWDQDMIIEWIGGPKDYIRKFTGDEKARAKMTFHMKSLEDRTDIAAYLATFSGAEAAEDMPESIRMTHGDTPFDEDMAHDEEKVDLSGYERVKQELVAPPNAPKHEQIATGKPKIIEIELTVEEKKIVIDGIGTEIFALTYNGSVPAPMIVAHQGDYIELTLRNPEGNRLEHNIDLHAVTGALGGAGLTTVAPGEEAKIRFKATKSGAFIYHCAPEGSMTPYHVTHGMNGVIMVLPREGLTDGEGKSLTYDSLFYIAEQDYYVSRDENGDFKTYEFAGDDFGDWVEAMHTLTPSHIVFNGRTGILTGEGALKAKVGERVLMVHSQANRDTRPHLIGGHGDYVWEEGAFANPPMRDLETWFVRGGSAGAALYTFMQPGIYVYLNHNLIEAVEFGAAAHIVVDGDWNNELLEQLYHGKSPE